MQASKEGKRLLIPLQTITAGVRRAGPITKSGSRLNKKVMIGAGSGFAGDRSGASGPLIEALRLHDGPRFLIFETLAERTLALAQVDKSRDSSLGYVPSLERLVRPALARCKEEGIRIVGNFGAANPRAAAERIAGWAAEAGYPDLKIAVVEGDDLLGVFSDAELCAMEVDGKVLRGGRPVVAANVYLGAWPIAGALDRGAEVVVTGRVADPALVLGPLVHAFGWGRQDWDRLAAGTLAGHLLECGAQVTGGYFADPGVKDVEGLDTLGYPLAEVDEDGIFTITKPAQTGGRVDRQTVTEQLLYEIHDPAAYLTPDVTLDVTAVEFTEQDRDRVRVTGARGRARPDTLKATVCVEGGYLAEAEISYAGVNAGARAALAIEIIRKRMARAVAQMPVRTDIIGVVSVLGDTAGRTLADVEVAAGPQDLRVRFAASTFDRNEGERLLDEVEALYCTGPAGGGGVRRRLTPVLRSASCLVPRDAVETRVTLLGRGA